MSTSLSVAIWNDVDATTGKITIDGATSSWFNYYTTTVTATVNGKTVSEIFYIRIKNPCQGTTFSHSPYPISTMTVIMPSAAITS